MLCLDGGVIIRSLIPCKGKLFFNIFFFAGIIPGRRTWTTVDIVFAFV